MRRMVWIGVAALAGCAGSSTKEMRTEQSQPAAQAQMAGAQEGFTVKITDTEKPQQYQIPPGTAVLIRTPAPTELERQPVAGRETVVRLSSNVIFPFDEATLLPSARTRLDKVADTLKRSEAAGIVVEGHTDAIGSAQYNEDLSLRRADAVRDHLVSRGVDPQRISAAGEGESQPIGDNETPEGRAMNRRVDIATKPMQLGGERQVQPKAGAMEGQEQQKAGAMEGQEQPKAGAMEGQEQQKAGAMEEGGSAGEKGER